MQPSNPTIPFVGTTLDQPVMLQPVDKAGGTLVVEFDEPGEIMIGCHLPGHWDAGMVATFAVS